MLVSLCTHTLVPNGCGRRDGKCRLPLRDAFTPDVEGANNDNKEDKND